VLVPSDGRWHHVAVTVDRDSFTGVRFYLDAVPGPMFDPTPRPGSVNSTRPFRVGSRSMSVANVFRGLH
jgi:hypothetical protein